MGKTFREAIESTRSPIVQACIGRSGSGAHKGHGAKDDRRVNRLEARDAKMCSWFNEPEEAEA